MLALDGIAAGSSVLSGGMLLFTVSFVVYECKAAYCGALKADNNTDDAPAATEGKTTEEGLLPWYKKALFALPMLGLYALKYMKATI